MSEVLIIEFDASPEEYKAVNTILGIDQDTGEGDWPAGMKSHTAGAAAGGGLMVVEVWDSQEAQGEFMSSRLGPALGEAGLNEPKRIEWMSGLSSHHFH
jgi:hypothetical protein